MFAPLVQHDLAHELAGRLDSHISARGARIFGGDEILEGDMPPPAVVAPCRGMTGVLLAARQGNDVVSYPAAVVYLDYCQAELPEEPIPVSIASVADADGFKPAPDGLNEEKKAGTYWAAWRISGSNSSIRPAPRYSSFPSSREERAAHIAEVVANLSG